MTIKRRAFISAVGLGTFAATAGLAQGSGTTDAYTGFVSPSTSTGVGRGQGASLSIVWTPPQGSVQLPPLKARLVIFDIGGKALANKEVLVEPFSGVSVEFELPPDGKRLRRSVFGYVFVEGLTGELVEVLGTNLEVYDVSSGRTDRAGITPGLG